MRRIHVIVGGVGEDHVVKSGEVTVDEAVSQLQIIGTAIAKNTVVELDWLRMRPDKILAAYLYEQ